MSDVVRMYVITNGKLADRVCYTEGTLESAPKDLRYGVFASNGVLDNTGIWTCDNWTFRNLRSMHAGAEFNKTGKFRYVKTEQ